MSDQYNAENLNILIVMIDRFDVRKLKNSSPHLIKIAWMRNWFDRWGSWPWFDDYEFLWASSDFGVEFIRREYSKKALLMRIATNHQRFFADAKLLNRDIDICFAGSYWNVRREIEDSYSILKKYTTHFYGHGLDSHPTLKEFHKGTVNYENLAAIYFRTKVVVDDGAVSTKKWASVNSRVFDAAVAGCLVISNAAQGVQELNGCSIPVYSTPGELDSLLKFYLNDSQARLDKVLEIQRTIRSHHSYDTRAIEFCSQFPERVATSYRIAIKVAAPSDKVKHQWGDYHYAVCLKKALERKGHAVRIDLLYEWQNESCAGDDVNLVLRGLSRFETVQDQINIMWNISHPDKVELDEFAEYDCVFVASELFANKLKEKLPEVRVNALLQCTDVDRFYSDIDGSYPSHDLLFVGNSRNVYRDSVKYCVQEDIAIAVYGSLWEQFVSPDFIMGENISNEHLRKYYSNCSVVLNDHWDSMKENGFLSNRIYDAVASGSIVVSDRVNGIGEDYFGSNVIFYSGKDEFLSALNVAKQSVANPEVVSRIRENDSFEARASEILEMLDSIHKHKVSYKQS